MATNIQNHTRECMLRDLQKIRKKMNGLLDDNFKERCGEWVAQRRATLSVLDELQRELDAIHKNTSTARAVGAGVSVLGGLAALIGFGLRLGNPLMKEVGNELVKYGGGAGIVGGAAAGVANVTETMLNKNTINKVKNALRADEISTQYFLSWFTRSQELEDIFQRVFGCSVLSDTANDIFEVVESSKVVCDRGGKLLVNLVNSLSDIGDKILVRGIDRKHMKKMLLTANGKTKFLLEEFCNDKRVREAVWSICELARRSPIILDIAKIGIGVNLKMNSLNGSIAMFMPQVGRPLLQTASRMMNGLFLAITLAISVAALISAAEDIKEGKSKYTKMLNDAKTCLSCELNFLLTEYPALKQ